MPPRLKDIARDLGVSVVTVSKVLRNHSDIGEETRERVLKRVKELNYRPNLTARALVTGRSHAIGFVAPDLIHPFFGQVAKAISRVLRPRGYSLIITSAEENALIEKDEIAQLLSRRVDAMIVASSQQSVESFEQIQEQDVPLVLIDRRMEGVAAHFVGVDDTKAGLIATQHLLRQGCRRIAHIRGSDVSTALDRMAGYKQAIAAAGMAVPPGYLASSADTEGEGDRRGCQAMQALLKLDPRPDGVFCFNDPMAVGAIEAVLDAGLRVPDDIAIAGCGNTRYAHMLRVPLTSVDQNSEGLGESVAGLVLELIESEVRGEPRAILLEPRLVVRASSLMAGQQCCDRGKTNRKEEIG